MTIACVACETSFSADYDLLTFIQDVNEVLFYLAPFVLCVVLWKLFVTNRTATRKDLAVLRLDRGVSTYSPSAKDR